MAIYKRGRIYWYKFMWDGETVRASTRQTNHNTARQMEAAHRASLAKGEVGIRDKTVAPTLAEFIKQRFEPWGERVPTRASSCPSDLCGVGFDKESSHGKNAAGRAPQRARRESRRRSTLPDCGPRPAADCQRAS